MFGCEMWRTRRGEKGEKQSQRQTVADETMKKKVRNKANGKL
jgi:hypothetical protein